MSNEREQCPTCGSNAKNVVLCGTRNFGANGERYGEPHSSNKHKGTCSPCRDLWHSQPTDPTQAEAQAQEPCAACGHKHEKFMCACGCIGFQISCVESHAGTEAANPSLAHSCFLATKPIRASSLDTVGQSNTQDSCAAKTAAEPSAGVPSAAPPQHIKLSRMGLRIVGDQLDLIPIKNAQGWNRYNTDTERVLHVWADGESYDIRVPKEEFLGDE